MICPVCSGNRSEKLYTVRRPDLGRDISYDIRSCKSCTFTFAEGPVSREILTQVYSKVFHSTSQQYAPVSADGEFTEESRKFPIVQNAIARTEKLRKSGLGGSLLDIGAGRGYFVKAASQVFRAEGIELNPDVADFASAMNIQMFTGDFLDSDFGARKYDVITMWDVLASLPQPRAAIAKVRSLLNSGGTLVMTLPDGASMVSRIFRQYWPLMIPPINLGFYSPGSVRTLLSGNGFMLRSIRYEAKRISIDFLLRKLFRAAGLAVFADRKLPLSPSIAVPLNLHDIMTVTAVRED